MDIRLALMCGSDIPIPECQLTIHQPTIKEISLIGENEFFTGVQYLCLNKRMFSKDENVLENITNFQIFMTIMTDAETIEKKQSVLQSCQLLFPNYKIMVTPRGLVFKLNGVDDIMINVDQTNFEALQDIVSQICCLKSDKSQDYNPANDKAREIAEKLKRGRQRVAQEKHSDNNSIFVQYLSILSVGLHMSLQDLMKLTMYQLYDLVERFSLYIAWDVDVRTRLAGGKPDSQPDNWMKYIH